jgi:hypothetical protein
MMDQSLEIRFKISTTGVTVIKNINIYHFPSYMQHPGYGEPVASVVSLPAKNKKMAACKKSGDFFRAAFRSSLHEGFGTDALFLHGLKIMAPDLCGGENFHIQN